KKANAIKGASKLSGRYIMLPAVSKCVMNIVAYYTIPYSVKYNSNAYRVSTDEDFIFWIVFYEEPKNFPGNF
ncbi:MAG: hypothetical protein ABIP10_18400, partial [Ferruginibacter sp.]